MLTQLISEANSIEKEILATDTHNKELTTQVNTLRDSLAKGLHAPAESAVNAISTLVHSIEELSRVSITGNKAMVSKCKNQSLAVSAKFEDLHQKVKAVLATATNVRIVLIKNNITPNKERHL